MRRPVLVRAGVLCAAAAMAALAFAAPASAHVTVNPNTATQGGYTKVSFRVPNEQDATDTVKVEVDLPQDTPIASVSLKPVAGWTAVAEKTKLAKPITSDDGQITEAVTKITWTADPAAVIKPGQFQEFDVSLGPLPQVAQLEFKALQTYSDGTVVRWIDEPSTTGTEPDHPAPILKLAKADTPVTVSTESAATPTGATTTGNGLATGLAVAALAVGLLALVAGVLAYRKSTTTTRTG